MSVISAFNSAVSGLNSQGTALSNISNNIANSSTVGYKSVNTQFEDMVLDSSGASDISESLAGVRTVSRVNISKAGESQSTGASTDIAINGGGFLVVNTKANSASGTYLATRAGSFRPDSSGNLVNAAGYYLQGVPLDAQGKALGNNSGSTLDSLSTVNLTSVAVATSPTTKITFAANLPSTDTAYSATPPAPSNTTVNYYDALGQTHTLTMKFTPSQPSSAAGAQKNEWKMEVFDDASATPGTAVQTVTLDFAASDITSTTPIIPAGTLKQAPTGGTYNPATGALTVTTGSGQKIDIRIGTVGDPGGMTQMNGPYTTTNLQKDGSGFGLLQSVNVTTDGQVMANFSNGNSRPIYQLKLANTPNPTGMAPVDGGAFAFSLPAGLPTLNDPGTGAAGTTLGGSLEGSNVDVTTELTNLIETQRAYSSAATVIQTGSQMLDVANHLSQ